MTEYTYQLSDTASGAVDAKRLYLEILDAALGPSSLSVDGEIVVAFDAALSADDETALSAVVASHQGNPLTVIHLRETISFVQAERGVTAAAGSWEILGGVVTRPSFFGDVAKQLGRVTAMVQATAGAGGEMPLFRVVEDDGTSVRELTSVPAELPDTGGSWSPIIFNTDVPPSDATVEYEYRIEGSLNGAVDFRIRHGSFSLVEVV